MSEPRNADATCCRTGWVGHNAITFDLMGDTFSCVELRSTSMVLMNSIPLDCTVDKIGRWSNGELDRWMGYSSWIFSIRSSIAQWMTRFCMFRSVENTKSVECAPGANVARRMGTFDMTSDRPVAQRIMKMSQQSGNISQWKLWT
jgi:hypothetical protein